MTRRDYLALCREVAIIPEGINHAREVPERYQVLYDGIHYYPIRYEIRFDSHGEPYEVAVMHDLKADSTTSAELTKVSKLEGNYEP